MIQDEFAALNKFKKALAKADQAALDELIYASRMHLHAGSYASFLDPLHAILVSMLIEQEKRIQKLESRLSKNSPANIPVPVLSDQTVSPATTPVRFQALNWRPSHE